MTSEDATMLQKRALLNPQDTGGISGLVYPNSPIPRSPRKPTTHFPSSSGQPSSVFRHKSPASRHLSPHRSVSRNKIVYNWEDVNSIRKTQSTALPARKIGLWPRGTTASTPDLKVEDQSVGTEATLQPGSSNSRINGRTNCYYNLRLVFVILNCIILVSGLIHLTTGVLMTVFKETVLIIVEYRLFVVCVILLYIEAVVLLLLSVIELCCVNRGGSRKRHFSCTLLIATLTISLGILQNTVQTNIQNNLKHRMIASMKLEPDVKTRAIWDYFQETFGCCGTRGHLDWCEKNYIPDGFANSTDFLGSYTCHLPASCCVDDVDKTMYSEKKFRHMHSQDAIPCVISPTPWNTHHIGCLAYVRREIYYMGKLFRIVSFGTGIVLFLSSAIATLFFVYI